MTPSRITTLAMLERVTSAAEGLEAAVTADLARSQRRVTHLAEKVSGSSGVSPPGSGWRGRWQARS